jgi:hypothetical protein
MIVGDTGTWSSVAGVDRAAGLSRLERGHKLRYEPDAQSWFLAPPEPTRPMRDEWHLLVNRTIVRVLSRHGGASRFRSRIANSLLVAKVKGD